MIITLMLGAGIGYANEGFFGLLVGITLVIVMQIILNATIYKK